MTREELKEKAADLPLAPGVYLMMDKMGKVIYVGKAKKLKNRVSQYFQDSASHTVKTRQMVSQIDHFDTIFVSSEFEALVLENSLIKRHMPRYNILLKDDKGYPFVRLSRETYPRFTMVSRYANDSARYFGPFGGRFETRQALDHVGEIAAVEGIDAVVIGPNDLSIDLGVPGDLGAPAMKEAQRIVAEAAARAGKASGMITSRTDVIRECRDRGMTVLSCDSEVGMLLKMARKVMGELQA